MIQKGIAMKGNGKMICLRVLANRFGKATLNIKVIFYKVKRMA